MDLIKKNITVMSAEEKATQSGKVSIVIKDENNLTYRIWKLKADGTESKAYQAYTQAESFVGSRVAIGFQETQGQTAHGAATFRSIVMIGPEDQELDAQANLSAPITNQVPNYLNQQKTPQNPILSQSRDFEKEAEGKVRHGFAIEAFKKDMKLGDDTKKIINEWVNYVMGTPGPSKQEDGIDVENLPF